MFFLSESEQSVGASTKGPYEYDTYDYWKKYNPYISGPDFQYVKTQTYDYESIIKKIEELEEKIDRLIQIEINSLHAMDHRSQTAVYDTKNKVKDDKSV